MLGTLVVPDRVVVCGTGCAVVAGVVCALVGAADVGWTGDGLLAGFVAVLLFVAVPPQPPASAPAYPG